MKIDELSLIEALEINKQIKALTELRELYLKEKEPTLQWTTILSNLKPLDTRIKGLKDDLINVLEYALGVEK